MKRLDKFKNQCSTCTYSIDVNEHCSPVAACEDCGNFLTFPHRCRICNCIQEAKQDEETCAHYKSRLKDEAIDNETNLEDLSSDYIFKSPDKDCEPIKLSLPLQVIMLQNALRELKAENAELRKRLEIAEATSKGAQEE